MTPSANRSGPTGAGRVRCRAFFLFLALSAVQAPAGEIAAPVQSVRLAVADAWPTESRHAVFADRRLEVEFASLQTAPVARVRMVVYLASGSLAAPLSPPVGMEVAEDATRPGIRLYRGSASLPKVDQESGLVLQVELAEGGSKVVCRKQLVAVPNDLAGILEDVSRFHTIWIDPELADLVQLCRESGIVFAEGDRLPASFEPGDLWIGVSGENREPAPDAPDAILFDPTLPDDRPVQVDPRNPGHILLRTGTRTRITEDPASYRRFRSVLQQLLDQP